MPDLDKVAKSAQPESVYNGLPLWVFLPGASEFRAFWQLDMHCKYLQPVYSDWLCYVCHCNLAVIITDNDSSHDIH